MGAHSPPLLHQFLEDWDARQRLIDIQQYIANARQLGYHVSEPVQVMATIDGQSISCWRITMTTPSGAQCDAVIPLKKRGTHA